MPLTPEDVSNKRFTPVRLREGYDMGEVDQFLDEVEAELTRLTSENEELRAQLSAAQEAPEQGAAATTGTGASPVVEPEAAAGPGTSGESEDATVSSDESDVQPGTPAEETGTVSDGEGEAEVDAAVSATGSSGGVETLRVSTVPEASTAAARLLEIATRNADEVVSDARTEADRVVTEAQTKAEQLESEAKQKSEKMESDARSRAEMLDSETSQRREQLFGELERERDHLSSEVEGLRSFEREYRSRLKNYFTQQLEALDAGETVESTTEAAHTTGGQPGQRSALADGDS